MHTLSTTKQYTDVDTLVVSLVVLSTTCLGSPGKQ